MATLTLLALIVARPVPTDDPNQFVPTDLTVLLGKVSLGDVVSLGHDDQNDLVVCNWFKPDIGSPWIRYDVTGNLVGNTPFHLQFTVKSKYLEAGSYLQKIFLYDYVTSAYVLYSSQPLAGEYSTVTVDAAGHGNDYIRAGDHQVKARVEVWQQGLSSVLQPCYSWEYAYWKFYWV